MKRGIAALCAIALIACATGCGDDTVKKPTRNGNDLLVQPFDGTLTDVPERPIAVATGEGAVWATSMAGGVLSKIDPSSAKTVGKPTVTDDSPYAVDAAFGKVWVAAFQNDKLFQIDPQTRKVIRYTKVPNRPFGLTHGFGSMWVTGIRGEVVTRIDPATGKREAKPISIGGPPYQVAAGFGYIWVTNIRDGVVVKIDPKTNKRVGEPIAIGRRACKSVPADEPLVDCGEPAGIVAAGKYIWVTNLRGLALRKGQGTPTQIRQKIPNGAVYRIDPKTNKIVGSAIPVPIRPLTIAGDDDSVWVVSLGANAVTRIDAKTAERDKLPIGTGGQPTSVAMGFGKVWFALSSDDQIASMPSK